MITRLFHFLESRIKVFYIKQLTFGCNFTSRNTAKFAGFNNAVDNIFKKHSLCLETFKKLESKKLTSQVKFRIDLIIIQAKIWLLSWQVRIVGAFTQIVSNLLLILVSLTAGIYGLIISFNRRGIFQKPPGFHLLKIADFLYKKETVEGIFNQIACDWRTDYFNALKEKRSSKARWINIRGRWEFYCAMFKRSPIGELIEIIKKFVK